MKKPAQILMKTLATIVITMFLVVPSFAQIVKEGTLPSILYNLPDTKVLEEIPIDIDWEQIHKEDALDRELNMPVRAGLSIAVGKGLNDFGEWTQLPDGKMLWRAALYAEGVIALGLVFEDYELPEGSELYIYNADKSLIVGALGSHNNHESKVLSTRVLYGDITVIEYIEYPNNSQKQSQNNIIRLVPQQDGMPSLSFDIGQSIINPNEYKTNTTLRIADIMYMYHETFNAWDVSGSKPNSGGSSWCQIDVNCSVGDSWQDMAKGVIKLRKEILPL